MWLCRAHLGERQPGDRELAEYLDKLNGQSKFDWYCEISQFVIHRTSAPDLVKLTKQDSAQATRERECEAFFYIAAGLQFDGDIAAARAFYRKCLGSGVSNFYEYRWAELESKKLESK
jgi:lipoprotein NlpI